MPSLEELSLSNTSTHAPKARGNEHSIPRQEGPTPWADRSLSEVPNYGDTLIWPGEDDETVLIVAICCVREHEQSTQGILSQTNSKPLSEADEGEVWGSQMPPNTGLIRIFTVAALRLHVKGAAHLQADKATTMEGVASTHIHPSSGTTKTEEKKIIFRREEGRVS